MKTLLFLVAATALSLSATAQITEIPAMTVGSTTVDMDTASLGSTTTTLAALRTAGAPLSAITMTASGASAGIYNTNPELGRALGWRANDGAMTLVPVFGSFDAFNLRLDLDFPSQEFGIAIGDWLGGMLLDFSYQGSPVGSILSSDYTVADAKFFRSEQVFDRVLISADPLSPGANWVVPQFRFQSAGSWVPFGSGCAGTNGVPLMSLTGTPNIGSTYSFAISNLPTGGGVYAGVLGFDNTSAVIGGNATPLPFDLAPIGAPTCFVLCDVANIQIGINNGGQGSYALPIPPEPAFAGIVFFNQVYSFDLGANALGVTSSRGARVTVQ